jgi:methionine salvage enolase-phosphatase E1
MNSIKQSYQKYVKDNGYVTGMDGNVFIEFINKNLNKYSKDEIKRFVNDSFDKSRDKDIIDSVNKLIGESKTSISKASLLIAESKKLEISESDS